MVEGCVSPETIIYLLKIQLIDAAVLNHNLKRVVSLLAWKLHVEKSIAAVKGELGAMLQKSVDSFETLLANSSAKHETMRRRLEKLDYEIAQLKQQCSFHNKGLPMVPSSFVVGVKPRLRKPIKKLGTLKQSTFARSESRGIRLLKHGVYTPVAFLGSHKELRWDDVMTQQHAKRSAEDDGRPQVAEMNEEDEKTLRLELDATTKHIYRRDPYNRTLEPGATPKVVGEDMAGERIVEMRGEEVDSLEHSLRDAQIDLAWHKEMTDMLIKELGKTREQANMFKNQVADIKVSSEQVIQDENRNWKMITDSLKVSSASER